MTTLYVGIGGNNGNNGQSWANRKATLNGAEDIPVVAGDTVYVGPGVYRELLTLDVSATVGNPITYIADVTGEHTDGVGGIVRITASDDDQTQTRAQNILASAARNYRTFRGFFLDNPTSRNISTTSGTNWIVEDCTFAYSASTAIEILGSASANHIYRRLVFYGQKTTAVVVSHSSTVSNSGHLFENCLVFGAAGGQGFQATRVGGWTIKNCTIFGCARAVQVGTALAAAQTVTVNNCIIFSNSLCFTAVNSGEITEDYNDIFGNTTDRTNTSTGTNSVTYPPLHEPPMLLSGFRFPWLFGTLSQWSAVATKAGTGESSDDMFGATRPATSAKKSWGPIQYVNTSRETTTTRTGSVSIKLADAGRHQMFVPTTNVSTVFSVYTQWEADYAGTKPQMVIKQPGQSDTTVTATGSSGSWEQLTTTLTPAALPPYVIVELVSSNTASATNFDTFFDDLTVS